MFCFTSSIFQTWNNRLMAMALISFLLFFCFFALNHVVYALNSDGAALLSLAEHWELPPPVKFSWNSSDSDPCSWVGVECDNRTQSVTVLNLTSYGISGQLGPEIGSLKQLKYLDISTNSLSGSIPSELGDCSLLEHLDLSLNFFLQEIPITLTKLRNARTINLYGNSLNGTIPESLFSIPPLENLFLNGNELSGTIPSNVGNASKLVQLWLSNNFLSGTIPSSLGDCSALQEINLDRNQLSGPLPESLNNLQQITVFDVSINTLEGAFPFELGNCKNTTFLDVSYNRFNRIPEALGNCTSLAQFSAIRCGLSGPIPPSLGQLTNLGNLQLSENRLSGGIPPELGNCRSLQDLHLGENQLTGRIPRELGLLKNLQSLLLYTNNLTGEIPNDIFKIQSLKNVSLYQNRLSGGLPTEITELRQLEEILLFENQLRGEIPQALGINSSSLLRVDLSSNKFTGRIPPNICFRKKLWRLMLAGNNLQGDIPSDMGSCFTLERLRLDENNLTGELPQFVRNPNLNFMDLSKNSFSGAIPLSFLNLTNVTEIDLSMNKLSGTIPPELGSLVHLRSLNLSHNGLEGDLPTELENCKQLFELDVSHNLLNGSIPTSLRSLQELTSLGLAENRFAGEIPSFLFEFNKLVNLQLGGNLLSGNIKPSIGSTQAVENLKVLNLSSNRMMGQIPNQLGNLVSLEVLDMSHNNLSGSLNVLDNLRSLVFINVSYNLFSGPIPENLLTFLNLSSTSFLGNSNLCVTCSRNDDPLCNSRSEIKHCVVQANSRKGLSKVSIAMITLGSLLVFAFLVVGLAWMFLWRKGANQGDESAPGSGSIPLDEIMKVTENLNDKYIIGRGAHGTVYKATIGAEKVYAVKKLDFVGIKSTSRSMIREIETVGMVRHRNLIKLEEFWFQKDYGLLLYRYMEKGSLQDVLHEGDKPLLWDVRYKIALGIAQGLSYLHFDCDPAIVHSDIKPMNILLNLDLEPHISDFGIAKLLDQSNTSSSSLSTAVLGTIGYIAPENAYTVARSKESDVYSFGVVLLELITRKKAVDPSFNAEQDIVMWVRSVWTEAGKILEVVDPSLVEQLINASVRDQVTSLLVVALRCTEREPSRRPNMRDVVKQLTDFYRW